MKTEAPLLPGFPSELIFSGFDSKYRLQLHASIFDIVWFGEGRWDWTDIYSMPVFLRRYWIKRINGITKERDEANERQLQQIKNAKSRHSTKRRR